MHDVVIPHNVQLEVYEALRQIRLMVKDTQSPILKDKKSLNGITEGTSAFFVDKNTLYRYTKINGKLIREDVSDEIDVDAVKELADKQIAAAPRAGDFNRIDTIEVVTGQERTDGFTYEQSNPPGTEFIFYTYGTQEDYINDENRLSGNEVTDISFEPETPPQEQGSFAVFITYTVSVEGKIFARLKTE